jgi:hypothetical protein
MPLGPKGLGSFLAFFFITPHEQNKQLSANHEISLNRMA